MRKSDCWLNFVLEMVAENIIQSSLEDNKESLQEAFKLFIERNQ
jgi:hypothetical protein